MFSQRDVEANVCTDGAAVAPNTSAADGKQSQPPPGLACSRQMMAGCALLVAITLGCAVVAMWLCGIRLTMAESDSKVVIPDQTIPRSSADLYRNSSDGFRVQDASFNSSDGLRVHDASFNMSQMRFNFFLNVSDNITVTNFTTVIWNDTLSNIFTAINATTLFSNETMGSIMLSMATSQWGNLTSREGRPAVRRPSRKNRNAGLVAQVQGVQRIMRNFHFNFNFHVEGAEPTECLGYDVFNEEGAHHWRTFSSIFGGSLTFGFTPHDGCAPPTGKLVWFNSETEAFGAQDGCYGNDCVFHTIPSEPAFSTIRSAYFFESAGDGTYHIKSAETNRYLQPASDQVSGSSVVHQSYDTDWVPDSGNAFKVVPSSTTCDDRGCPFRLTHVDTDLYLWVDTSGGVVFGGSATTFYIRPVTFYVSSSSASCTPTCYAADSLINNPLLGDIRLRASEGHPTESISDYSHFLIPVPRSLCPSVRTMRGMSTCKDVLPGKRCEGDGGSADPDTKNNLNNCPKNYEVYRKTSGDPSRGFLVVPVRPEECPLYADLGKCNEQVPMGGLCEGDGEADTDNGLNNCGGYDVYRVFYHVYRNGDHSLASLPQARDW